MKYILVCLTLLFLSGCVSKSHTVCMELGENANVHGDFGYFYDSATVDLNGPAHFYRVGKDVPGNPCKDVQPIP